MDLHERSVTPTEGLSPAAIHRSNSVTDDTSVIKTNDDATYAKLSCVTAGYYSDDFIAYFTSAAHPTVHREPEIKQGYWARVYAMKMLVQQFGEMTAGKGQIINIGCGFDTLYWRLVQEEKMKFMKFVEIDFSSTTAKKISHIMRPSGSKLKKIIEENSGDITVTAEHTCLHSPVYHLIGADMRQLAELESRMSSVNLDNSLPTLIIAECVLIYMSVERSAALLKFFANKFSQCSFVSYEQVNLSDSFSDLMQQNLRARGLSLAGVDACQDMESQRERFLAAGFTHVHSWTMQQVWETKLDKTERSRIEQLEFLDESELRTQLLQHYSIVCASKSTANTLIDLSF